VQQQPLPYVCVPTWQSRPLS